MDDTKEYYSKRAEEYEKIYHRDDPVRQSELDKIKNELSVCFKGLNVLEAACGTGYWTETISKAAKTTLSFDYSPEVIEIAKSKKLDAEFIIDDAYRMDNIRGNFNAGCANFWFSHIPKNKITVFLNCFHKKLNPGSPVFMADNVYVEGIGGKLITKPGYQDTYKLRVLSDGSAYEIIKNYYNEDELKDIFSPHAESLETYFGNCFWRIKYKTK